VLLALAPVVAVAMSGAAGAGDRSQPRDGGSGLVGSTVVARTGSWAPAPREVDGLSVLASVDESGLHLHTSGGDRSFLAGVNLGATVPGIFPGQLDLITAEQFARWLDLIGQVGGRVVRIYTILPPVFYEELDAYNIAHPDAPLYLIQGVYLADETAFVTTGDLWDPSVRETFLAELTDAHLAVTGHLERDEMLGRADGRWTVDVTRWIAGWIVGVEWDPIATVESDRRNRARPDFTGRYFQSADGATPTERWLSEMLDHLASLEADSGRSVPIAFVNWPSVDPLRHPDEPLEREDLVGVDANHVLPTAAWPGGTFASYHAYPYYPDFQRHEPGLQVLDSDGQPDPYRGYLRALRDHHAEAGIPVMISEFGVPSSFGAAHFGPRGRDQGGHSERDAMAIDAEMLRIIHEEGLAGGLLFAFADEWFKFTWNTVDVIIPAERRPLWHDQLTNEQHFGLLATDSGLAGRLRLGDPYEAWSQDSRVVHEARGQVREIRVAHDEAFLYLRIRFDDEDLDQLVLGFDVLPDRGAGGLPGSTGIAPGAEVAVELSAADASGRIEIWAGADPTSVLYANQEGVPVEPGGLLERSGSWVPRRLIVNRPVTVPSTGERFAAELFDVSELIVAPTDPDAEGFDARAHLWFADGDVALRLPWALLGFSDPSSLQALNVAPDAPIAAVPTPGIELTLVGAGDPLTVPITWEPWNTVTWTERLKDGASLFSDALVEVLGG
jgi:hypothetical protein